MRSGKARRLILASLSPRRRELLRSAGVDFSVAQAHVVEDPLPCEPPAEAAARLALAKALDVSSREPGAWVLAADTIVVLDGEILGKPESSAQAGQMLERLSGRQHQVLTGVALIDPGGEVRHRSVVSTMISFRRLGPCEIEEYVGTGEPFDKAGAYGIQGRAGHFVSRIEGSYTNVIGLPLESVLEVLASFGLYCADG